MARRTARIPIVMLTPWSPSPTSPSRSHRKSLFDSTSDGDLIEQESDGVSGQSWHSLLLGLLVHAGVDGRVE